MAANVWNGAKVARVSNTAVTYTSNVMFNSSGNVQPTLNQPMLRPVSGTSSSLG